MLFGFGGFGFGGQGSLGRLQQLSLSEELVASEVFARVQGSGILGFSVRVVRDDVLPARILTHRGIGAVVRGSKTLNPKP